MASLASISATRPLVSIMPRASIVLLAMEQIPHFREEKFELASLQDSALGRLSR